MEINVVASHFAGCAMSLTFANLNSCQLDDIVVFYGLDSPGENCQYAVLLHPLALSHSFEDMVKIPLITQAPAAKHPSSHEKKKLFPSVSFLVPIV